MIEPICIDNQYSTTKLLVKEKPEIVHDTNKKLKTILFYPKREGRKGEGGLRTKGYFKKSLKAKSVITVITVVYNGEKYLEEAINSVINQNYDNVEYLIIDGGSNDRTIEIIKKYEGCVDYWVSEPDKGIYDAMNKGISLATGEWMAILNSDDRYSSQDSLFALLEVEEQYDVAVSDVIMLTNEGDKIFHVDGSRPLYINIPYMHTGMYFRKRAYEKLGLYDIKYKIASDIEFIFRCKRLGLKFFQLKNPMVKMRDDGVSSTLFKNGRCEYRQIYIKYGGNLLIGWYGYFFSLIEKWAYNYSPVKRCWRLMKRLWGK